MDKATEIANREMDEIRELAIQAGKSEKEIEELMEKCSKTSLAGLGWELSKIKKEVLANAPKKKLAHNDVTATCIDPNTVVVRESCGRARKDLGDIDELATSILTKGQITPILITKDNELVAGERRLRACQRLNLPVQVVYREQLDDITMKELELEENLQRKDMEWQEKLTLTKEITELKQAKYGEKRAGRGQTGWALGDTANLMGKSHSSVQKDIQLATAMEKIPELANAKTADDARKLLRKMEEELLVAELIKREGKKKEGSFATASADYILADAIKELPKIDSNSLDFADVDTPYGIDLGDVKKSQTETKGLKSIGNYAEWDRDKYLPTCEFVAREIFRILKDNTWCTWWFGIEYYEPLKRMLTEVGFILDPIPSQWYAGGKAAQTNQPQIMLGKSYDTFFICRKGKPVFAKPGRHNVFECPKVDAHNKIHPTEKPLPMYEELIKTIVLPGSKAIVPFLGSGNTLRALYINKCSGFGYDIPEHEDIKNKFLLRVQEDIETEKYKL